jgi:hypothetical protein
MRRFNHVVAALAMAGCATSKDGVDMRHFTNVSEDGASEAELAKSLEKLAPVEISVDLSKLPDSERSALKAMLEAAEVMDRLFLRQVWAGNEELLARLQKDTSPEGRTRLRMFLVHKGPWDRLEHHAPFIERVPKEKPQQASFYPEDTGKEDVEKWIAALPEAERSKATGFFSVIRRGPSGSFILLPYSQEYRPELELAAQHLRTAASLTQQPTLKRFLELRAKALLDDEYYESDVAWMELDASIEPTIGPYENYEDEWFNYKAAFEAFITLRDDIETSKLARFSGELQGLEDALPIDPSLRNPKLGALAPIRVVNEVYASGDAARGVRTAAFNLPNDERVTKEKGSKRVMLKNVQEAKFRKVLIPISRVAISEADQANIDFESFFTHILMHELMHGLGPHTITVNGSQTTVRKALKEISGALEEAKADISGLWALQKLIDKGSLDRAMEQKMYVTFLASSFRTMRFGLTEAHGKGMALQVNYLLDEGGFVVNDDGTFAVDKDKIKSAVEKLTAEIMTLQAKGDYDAAKAFLEKYGVLRGRVKDVIAKLEGVPIDILPRHRTAEAVLGRQPALAPPSD